MRRQFWLLVLSFAMPAFAADDDWLAAAASIKITPEKPVLLAGYAARTKPFEKVTQDIFAKALALQDSAGSRAVIVTLDICIIPADVANQIRDRIAQKTKLDAAAILMNLSHTHAGPAISLSNDPDPGKVNRGSDETIEYTKIFMDKVVSVAAQAVESMKPAKLSYASGIANFAMNRRQFTAKGVILGINPRGLVDRTVPVLRIDSADGKLSAVLFGYACHNTSLPSSNLGVCGDYAGYAKEFIEKQNPGVQAIFMQGCGGDANPYPAHTYGAAEAHGEELGKEVCRVLGLKLQPIHGPLKCAAEPANLPLQKFDRPTLETLAKTKGPQSQGAQQILAILDRNEKPAESHRAPVSAWQFGPDLTLIALPEEVVIDYVRLLEDNLGPLKLWVAGYSHEVTGYVPSKRVLKEGGYETRGLYTEVGIFAPDVEDELLRAAKKAATDAGRKFEP